MNGSTDQIRKNLLTQRRALSSSDVSDWSREATLKFLQLFFASNEISSRTLRVGMYRPLPTEFQVGELISPLRERNPGCRFFFPRVIREPAKSIEFVDMTDLMEDSSAWISGSFGILEPHPRLSAIHPEELNLIIIPGVVFGESGERIGMGAGYYDRFLLQNRHALRVALAFEFQLLPQLEQKSTDQPVHWIVTEKRECRTSFVEEWFKSQEKV